VAITVHFQRQGKPVSLILDVVEVVEVHTLGSHHKPCSSPHSQSHTGSNLTHAFVDVVTEFGIEDKVSI